MFSQRTAWDREEAPLAKAVAERRAQGLPLLDLTASSPGRCGLGPQVDLGALTQPSVMAGLLEYDPQPFGLGSAREAVCGYYRDLSAGLGAGRGASLDPAQVCLTASTSEAYSFLFRLLCEPGDEVLIATPSYPLFDYLAALDAVSLVRYPLLYEHGWQIEPGALEARVTPRTRAVVLVHPNNPTGHFVSDGERRALEALCVEYGLALIVDEVFLDYPLAGGRPRSFAVGPHPALTFVLSGLSKVAALPQMKLAWLVTLGPGALRAEALARLEVIGDTFLSVGAPVQQALPAWLGGRAAVQEAVRQRVAVNLLALDGAVVGSLVTRLATEGGWYAVLRVPAVVEAELLALALLLRAGVLVYPGEAFGFADRGWLVVSLLPEPEEFLQGVRELLTQVII